MSDFVPNNRHLREGLLFDRVHPDGGTGRRAGAQRARRRDQVRVDIRKICNLGDWRAASQHRATWNKLFGTAQGPRGAFI